MSREIASHVPRLPRRNSPAELGWRPARAILDHISSTRGITVPDTPEQADWLARYVASLDAPPSLEDALRLLGG